MKRNRKECPECGRMISLSNFSKHYKSKSCLNYNNKIKIRKANNYDFCKETEKYICPFCNKKYKKLGICSHIWRSHTEKGRNFKPLKGKNNIAWNKGLTKETDERVRRNGLAVSKSFKENGHPFLGKKLSKESKEKISNSMKKAHSEGRAWNIGMSRWNNEPSYPEKFFMKVIKNEFIDKEYIREYPMGIYSADFAWEHKKKIIEIDGSQHQRFKEYIERDKRKDNYIISQGWKILRVSWQDMLKDTKKWINICREFIEN